MPASYRLQYVPIHATNRPRQPEISGGAARRRTVPGVVGELRQKPSAVSRTGTKQDDRTHRRPTRESAMNEELRKNHLQQLDDASAIWQALKEVLDEATEMSVASAISDGIGSDDRHWRAGYAQALQDVMGTLNRYRKV